MIFAEDSVWPNPKTGVLERVFPSDFLNSAVGFEQVSPTIAQLQTWANEPAFVRAVLDGAKSVSVGSFGARDIAKLNVLNGLRLVDFARAQQGRIWGQCTKIGLITAEDIGVVAPTANAVIGSMIDVLSVSPSALAEEVAKKAALEFYQIISSIPIPSAQWQLAMTVVGLGRMALDVFAQLRPGFVDRTRVRLPLAATMGGADAATLDAGRVTLINSDMSTSRDWSHFFAPSFTGPWQILELGEAKPYEMGFGFLPSEPGEQGSTRGDGAFGFMPGTTRALGILQQIMGWRSRRDDDDDTDTATWRSVYCNANAKPCGQTPENFRGDVDCRQCISIDSIRGTSRGDWHDFAGVSWSAGVNDHVTNVCDWLGNSTQALAALWNSFAPTNPATACIDAEGIHDLWRETFERFFEEDAERLWKAHNSYAWRALCSRFFASLMISREDGLVGGVGTLLDWRTSWGSNGDDGIWINEPPPIASLHAGARSDASMILGITATPFTIADSIWTLAIQPATRHLGAVQRRMYESTTAVYLWEDQGAHWNSKTGKLRNNWAGKAYDLALRSILDSPTLQKRVNMGHVVDPKIKALLIQAGVKPYQGGVDFQAPAGADKPKGKPPRAPLSSSDPIQPLGDEWPDLPLPPPPQGGYPGDPLNTPAPERAKLEQAKLEREEAPARAALRGSGRGGAAGAVAGAAAVAALVGGTMLVRRRRR